jgi:Transposase DDE domain
LIERREDGSVRYAFSNLPANTPRLRAVRYGHRRWPVEQGYQPMKQALGLDHFEGRSWHGFHRHAVLVMMAYGFLTLERLRLQDQGEQQQQQQQEADRAATAVSARHKRRRRVERDEPPGAHLECLTKPLEPPCRGGILGDGKTDFGGRIVGGAGAAAAPGSAAAARRPAPPARSPSPDGHPLCAAQRHPLGAAAEKPWATARA